MNRLKQRLSTIDLVRGRRLARRVSYGVIALAAWLMLSAPVQVTHAGIGCDIYNAISPELDEGIVVAAIIAGILIIIAAIVGFLVPDVKRLFGNWLIVIASVGVLLLIYINLAGLLTWIAQIGGGTLDVAAILAAC
jgi:ABC-type amino acid transport system permease subunit